MKRTLAVLAGLTAATSLVAINPAGADPAPLGTSYATAATVAPGSGVNPAVSTSGDLGGLLDFLSPVTDQYVSPLTAALSTLPDATVSDVVTALGSSVTANSADSSTPAPAAGTYPDCGSDGWSASTCFGTTIGAAGLTSVTLASSSAQGWAAADPTAASAGARAGGVTLSALGVDVGTLGTITSSATCRSAQSCASTGSVDGTALLGGAVAVKSAADGTLLVSVSGAPYVAAADLADASVTDSSGRAATVSSTGDGLKVSISMTLGELSSALGLTTSLDSLNAYDAGSTISLDVFLRGHDAAAAGHGAGLVVGLGLNADINVSVFGLVGTEIVVTDSSTGNLTDLQLAYTAAANADGQTRAGAAATLT